MTTEELERNRKKYKYTKKASFIKRWKCKHNFLYIGIRDGIRKMYFCDKCGHEQYY